MLDAIIISDVHLGSFVSRTDDLSAFLNNLPPTRRLVINGDLMDSTAAGFEASEVAILDQLQALHYTGLDVIWIPGNHDPHPEKWASLLSVTVAPYLNLISAGKTFRVTHGCQWDAELLAHPYITEVSIVCSRLLGRVSAPAARWAKGWEKHLRDLPKVVRTGATALCQEGSFAGVICGHSHFPEEYWGYINEGSWCENEAPTYCTVGDGNMALHQWGGS